jgi:hypothetical protein
MNFAGAADEFGFTGSREMTCDPLLHVDQLSQKRRLERWLAPGRTDPKRMAVLAEAEAAG